MFNLYLELPKYWNQNESITSGKIKAQTEMSIKHTSNAFKNPITLIFAILMMIMIN